MKKLGLNPLLVNSARELKVVLYSHDTMGLGHMRRNLLIAQSLVRSPLKVKPLIMAGAHTAGIFASSAGIDCLTLPSLRKIANGQYEARNLEVDINDIIKIRAKTICAAVEAFAPDVFIVDNVPRGVKGELDLTLEMIQNKRNTLCVLGLRDILDDPDTIRKEWEQAANEETIKKYFDAVWVYGDQNVYDLVRAYGFSPETVAKTRYTGYFDQRKRLDWTGEGNIDSMIAPKKQNRRLVLCVVGGGQDGSQLAESFVKTKLPEDYFGILVAGPLMPAQTFQSLCRSAAEQNRVRVIKQFTEPTQLLEAADRVISMGGYNTVSEILSFGKKSLIVPRIKPRTEQKIRAERLSELGLIDFIHPDQASPEKLSEWLKSEPYSSEQVKKNVNLNGLDNLSLFFDELVARRTGCQTFMDVLNQEFEYVS